MDRRRRFGADYVSPPAHSPPESSIPLSTGNGTRRSGANGKSSSPTSESETKNKASSSSRPKARPRRESKGRSSSPLSDSSSSVGMSVGEEHVKGNGGSSHTKARPTAQPLKHGPKVKRSNSGKRKVDGGNNDEVNEAAASAKTRTGIILPPKLPPPAPLFTSIHLPPKIQYEDGSTSTSSQQEGSSSRDAILSGIQAQVASSSSKDISFGPGRRVLSSSSIFSADNFTDPESLGSQPGPSTPTKKQRLGGIILPPKSTDIDTVHGSSQEEQNSTAIELQPPEAQWEMLKAASQSGHKQSPHRRKPKEVKVPTDVRALKTCPFCQVAMPRRLSEQCCEMMQPWLDRYHASKPIKATDTAAVCAQHRAESEIIPQGKKQGWPTVLNLDKLERRLDDNAFRALMEELLRRPRESAFMQAALERRLVRNRKMNRSPAEILDVQAGYYGETGYEVLRKTLTNWFYFKPMDSNQSFQSTAVIESLKPLTYVEFVGDVMIPELACHLIIDDYKRRKGINQRTLTFEEARDMKLRSAPYGIAMFPAEAASASNELFATADVHRNKPTASPSNSRKLSSQTITACSGGSTVYADVEKSPRPKPVVSLTSDVKKKAGSVRPPCSSAPALGTSVPLDPTRPVRPRPLKAHSQPEEGDLRGMSSRMSIDISDDDEEEEEISNRGLPKGEDEGMNNDKNEDDDDDFFDRRKPSLSFNTAVHQASQLRRETMSTTKKGKQDSRGMDNDVLDGKQGQEDEDILTYLTERSREETSPSSGDILQSRDFEAST